MSHHPHPVTPPHPVSHRTAGEVFKVRGGFKTFRYPLRGSRNYDSPGVTGTRTDPCLPLRRFDAALGARVYPLGVRR